MDPFRPEKKGLFPHPPFGSRRQVRYLTLSLFGTLHMWPPKKSCFASLRSQIISKSKLKSWCFVIRFVWDGRHGMNRFLSNTMLTFDFFFDRYGVGGLSSVSEFAYIDAKFHFWLGNFTCLIFFDQVTPEREPHSKLLTRTWLKKSKQYINSIKKTCFVYLCLRFLSLVSAYCLVFWERKERERKEDFKRPWARREERRERKEERGKKRAERREKKEERRSRREMERRERGEKREEREARRGRSEKREEREERGEKTFGRQKREERNEREKRRERRKEEQEWRDGRGASREKWTERLCRWSKLQ